MQKILCGAAWVYVLVFALAGFSSARAAEGDAAFAVSPESAHSLLERAISDAKESIYVNIYLLTTKNVTRALADKAASGVQVVVLLEGETYGGTMLSAVKKTLDELSQDLARRAPKNAKFLVMTGQQGQVKRRFVFNHGKYLVVDKKKVFVSSENFTGSAFGNRNVVGGTRGWQLEVENASLARALSELFLADSQESNADILPFDKAPFLVKDPPQKPFPPALPRTVPLFPLQTGKASAAALCVSPDSLPCLVTFLRSAKTSLVVEHLSLPLAWIDYKKQTRERNPIVEELVAAAKRGVRVRVLLNDDSFFGDEGGAAADPETKNAATIAWLREQAVTAKLPLEAGTFGGKGVEVNYLHNKGMVADGRRVFVGSINGTQNSVVYNREVGVALESEDAAKFFGEVFDFDWSKRLGALETK